MDESVLIVARARYNVHVGQLDDAGADVIVSEEERVGDALGSATLKHLGDLAET